MHTQTGGLSGTHLFNTMRERLMPKAGPVSQLLAAQDRHVSEMFFLDSDCGVDHSYGDSVSELTGKWSYHHVVLVLAELPALG